MNDLQELKCVIIKDISNIDSFLAGSHWDIIALFGVIISSIALFQLISPFIVIYYFDSYGFVFLNFQAFILWFIYHERVQLKKTLSDIDFSLNIHPLKAKLIEALLKIHSVNVNIRYYSFFWTFFVSKILFYSIFLLSEITGIITTNSTLILTVIILLGYSIIVCIYERNKNISRYFISFGWKSKVIYLIYLTPIAVDIFLFFYGWKVLMVPPFVDLQLDPSINMNFHGIQFPLIWYIFTFIVQFIYFLSIFIIITQARTNFCLRKKQDDLRDICDDIESLGNRSYGQEEFEGIRTRYIKTRYYEQNITSLFGLITLFDLRRNVSPKDLYRIYNIPENWHEMKSERKAQDFVECRPLSRKIRSK